MTTIDTAHLRRLAEAATPGPWEAGEPVNWDNIPQASVNSSGVLLTWDDHSGEVFKPEDAEYVAAIDPPTLIALLDELEQAKSDLAVAEEEVRERDEWIELYGEASTL